MREKKSEARVRFVRKAQTWYKTDHQTRTVELGVQLVVKEEIGHLVLVASCGACVATCSSESCSGDGAGVW